MGWFDKLIPSLPLINMGLQSFAGPLTDYAAQEADRKASRDAADADRQFQNEIANKNFAMQEDFAKNGVRWRVADAQAAGLHPLAALGMMPTGSSPVSVMSGGGPTTSSRGNLYRSLANMGQNVTRAAMSTQTAEERLRSQAELENLKSQTDLNLANAAEARKRVSMPGNPPMPDPYGGTFGGDIRESPYKHQMIRGPNGMELHWSDAYSRSQMSRPLSMFGNDFIDILKDAYRGSKSLRRNLLLHQGTEWAPKGSGY